MTVFVLAVKSSLVNKLQIKEFEEVAESQFFLMDLLALMLEELVYFSRQKTTYQKIEG